MRYIKNTFSYLLVRGKGTHYLFLFLVALIPSAILSYGIRGEFLFGNLIKPQQYDSWVQMWLSFFPNHKVFIAIALGLAVVIIAKACLNGALIRHFRVGDFSFRQIWLSFNDYALPCLISTLLYCAIILFAFTLFTLFAYMWFAFCSQLVYTVLSFISFFIISAATIYIISGFTTYLPMMCIKGDYSPSAISAAFYQSRGKQKYFLSGHCFGFCILLASSLIAYFTSRVWYISWIINSVGFALTLVFVMVFDLTAYFGETCLPREDLNVSPYKHKMKK